MVHGVLPKGFTYAGSVYQQNAFGETDAENTGKGFAGRLTANIAELAGWNTKETVLHVGLAGFDSEYGVLPTTSSSGGTATSATVLAMRSGGRGLSNSYRLQIGGEVAGSSGYSAPSPKTASVQNKAYGLELAAAYGPFKVQGEYTNQSFDAAAAGTSNTAKADAQAFYVEALYMLTGENYADWYKNGAWGGIKPKNNFEVETGKGRGAWEIGFRYDEYSVDNVSFNANGGSSNLNRVQGSYAGSATTGATSYAAVGGGAKTYTAGIKWQLTPNMRVLANYSRTNYDDSFTVLDTALAGVNKEDLLMMRTQFSF